MMEETLLKMLPSFNSWDQTLQEYLRCHDIENNRDDEDETLRVVKNTHKMLTKIFQYFIQSAKVKESWNLSPEIKSLPLGQLVIVTAKKIGASVTFGIEEDNFILETQLKYPWHIKRMNDSFWLEFSNLVSLGSFKFDEDVDTCSGAWKTFRNSKSSVFNLIKSYIHLELFSQESLIDIGHLVVTWPIGTPWGDLLSNGCKAFGKFYTINYMLYRAEYLKNRQQGIHAARPLKQ